MTELQFGQEGERGKQTRLVATATKPHPVVCKQSLSGIQSRV